MSAHFGRCDCGTVTVWQDGERPSWTCHRCERVAELRTRNEQHAQSLASALSDAASLLASSSTRAKSETPVARERYGATAVSFLHDAEHIAGMTATATLAHIRRWHLND